MCNHLNLKILIHIFTIIYLILILIIMRVDNFVAHLDGLGGTPVCRGAPVAQMKEWVDFVQDVYYITKVQSVYCVKTNM
jgi:hypothetical protein